MLSVFICYGGTQGERIGSKLRNFLLKENFGAFLASPNSPDIPSGVNLDIAIYQALRNSHVMVPICTSGILSSQYALNEINLAVQLRIPIIPFREENQQLPPILQRSWSPVTFNPGYPGRKFRRLQIEIYRVVIFKLESQGKLIGARPTTIGIPCQLLRR